MELLDGEDDLIVSHIPSEFQNRPQGNPKRQAAECRRRLVVACRDALPGDGRVHVIHDVHLAGLDFVPQHEGHRGVDVVG